ncbi:hypothetical protein H1S01_15760 [Heliobacterium chlorum]|uniref:Uncharacterized protein n=1 Tax=Heliobacterium chlorum TaxID=2698 RepID=A0ABR7T5K5_HELCL|nr:hypothetical protein [Heliobacterium chlorum]MBC9785941.1 hypothetical protein [Heliobacterium chlorum]
MKIMEDVVRQITMTRLLRLRDVEIFLLRDGYCGDLISFMVLVDYRRPSSLEDYPYLKGIEEELNFSRANYIKVIFISDKLLSNDSQDEIITLAGGLLENKDNCHWNCDFRVLSPTEIEQILESRKYFLRFFERLLESNGLGIKLNIEDDRFIFLSQD